MLLKKEINETRISHVSGCCLVSYSGQNKTFGKHFVLNGDEEKNEDKYRYVILIQVSFFLSLFFFLNDKSTFFSYIIPNPSCRRTVVILFNQ